MKKILCFFALFILFPILVNAEVDYDIEHYYVNANILDNGDVSVKELIVLDGEFNGYERDILYANTRLEDYVIGNIDYGNSSIYNAKGISEVSIEAKYVDNVDFNTIFDNDYTMFTKGVGSLGVKGIYEETNLYGGYRYRMYYKANNDKVAFLISYKINRAVVISNDVAEFYWTFIGTEFEDDLRDIQIKVYTPTSDSSSNFRIWAHGDMTGNVEYIKKNDVYTGLYAYAKKINAKSAVDIRMTFDPSIITDKSELNHTGENALNKIIEVETKKANEVNKLRKEIGNKYYSIVTLSITYLVVLVLVWINTYKKYGKSPKNTFLHKYNRDFIDDYNVEVIDYLMKKNITPNAMSASIMNLIYKKNIKVEEIEGDKKKDNYKFTLLNEDNINETEKYLIDFLFNDVGKDKEFTTIELREYAKSTRTYNKFSTKYTTWKNKVLSDGKKENFYDSNPKSILSGTLMLFAAFAIIGLSGLLKVELTLGYLIIIPAIIFFIYSIAVNKKTEKGVLHYAKWNAFKNFLKDFGQFKEKELPEIILWERYLVYAVIFELADEVRKDMNVKIQEMNLSENNVYFPTFYYINMSNSINHAVKDAVKSNVAKVNAANANSSMSSGSGFGGGFSGGGGFGGGGGGGRGF